MKFSWLILASIIVSSPVVNAQQGNVNEIDNIIAAISDNPNWIEVRAKLNGILRDEKVDSALQAVKVKYYLKKALYKQHIEEYISFVKNIGWVNDAWGKNAAAWHIFEYSTDSSQLLQADKWVLEAIFDTPNEFAYLDTYANICYKRGKISEAIMVQTEVVWMSRFNPSLVKTLYKMNQGMSTWKYPSSTTETSKDGTWEKFRKKLIYQVDSVTAAARIYIEFSNEDKGQYVDAVVDYVDKFAVQEGVKLNEYAWALFQYTDNKSLLRKAMNWSKSSLLDSNSKANHYYFMDTYANLLYKLGNRVDAIKWEERAINDAPESEKDTYRLTLSKMKRGEKTW